MMNLLASLFPLRSMTLAQPAWLWLLLVVPLLTYWYYRKQTARYTRWLVSDLTGLGTESALRGQLRILLPVLRGLAWVLLVIALARPQATLQRQDIKAQGIDIMLAIDLSSSMLARDFKPDRLEASKEVAADFIDDRQYDRIGLVAFAGEAFTQCPLTTDHAVVKALLASLQCGFLNDGTAIGVGLATAVNRLKDSPAKSKVAILLTDGVNTKGNIDPITAIGVAQQYGVKVYTIGVGTQGLAPVPNPDLPSETILAPVEIDEALLQHIAQQTNGKYFRATNKESLVHIYDEIDRLEKTTLDITTIKRYTEEAYRFVALALLCLLLAFALEHTLLRSLP